MFISPTIKLQSGAEMPLVGFGTWKHDGDKAIEAVYEGVKEGYRLFDCACDYGNEKECGLGLKRALDEGIVKREEVWVASKLWNTFHHKEHVRAAVKKSLAEWGVDYFDLYYVHFPISLAYVPFETRYPPGWWVDGKSQVKLDPVPLRETWEALEACVDEGLIRHLGISNMTSALIMDLMSYARIKPSVLEVEIHPYNQQPRLIEYAHSIGLAVTAYSSFGPMGFRELKMPKALRTQLLFTHPVITRIAMRHGCTPAQVILRWATQRNIAVIPKSDTAAMMEENMRNVETHLLEEDMHSIAQLHMGLRFNDPIDDFPGCYIFC
ncbi:Aldo/keto reductase [Laetiporus sulphureus 93-53]|uniref:Aldo/keto reductase n=1 Tax=Laetiporus sulphureus 93-53 TaxID=1314785 RepID=A0A165E814_9APHY|nr:Aldo/keto reductase [Laetiporus sulphureus 93-53]KZT06421.1 Aldo/keto reductase [Laetiporus sulphureus 93-53]